jgi:predicted ATP-grasp superfamily ATP-dependent carboligase
MQKKDLRFYPSSKEINIIPPTNVLVNSILSSIGFEVHVKMIVRPDQDKGQLSSFSEYVIILLRGNNHMGIIHHDW